MTQEEKLNIAKVMSNETGCDITQAMEAFERLLSVLELKSKRGTDTPLLIALWDYDERG